ncbi:MAG: Pseudouridine synthase [Candidatus Magasanikbacteria bacterium GW2011_GWC2_37_14]|uniref:Pseudouridine synthase n=1 Tax=Candidatus Magasanikbacteria bacterium GW2011_GWC2_37_14 TaxID=1619046 RepID=A0A0G0GCT8_9BACT|nr:MAG: Pseudouridine synthase [Candidatus Magasanikbacteria bacterium GW2011_GWC2_37_14]
MISKNKKIIIKDLDSKIRLDVFLTEKLKLTRSKIQKLIEQKLILLNKELPKKTGTMILNGDEIEIIKPVIVKKIITNKIEKNLKTEIANLPIEIVAETSDYLVLNKPAGILVHPTEAGEENTLVNWLLTKYPKIKKVGDSHSPHTPSRAEGKNIRPGIVHRLDKEASGLLVIAKTQAMFEHLKKQFQNREINKEYLVLVHGTVQKNYDQIDFEIDRGHDGKMVARPKTDKFKVKNVEKIQEGKEALTEFVIEKNYVRYTLLRVKIFTGRTNQIRVHMMAYSHPVVGDKLYFNKRLNRKRDTELNRVFLHAVKLGFTDLNGYEQTFTSKLPKELESFLKDLN